MRKIHFAGDSHPWLLNIVGMETVGEELDCNPFEIIQKGFGTPKSLRLLAYCGFVGGYLAEKKECPISYDDLGLQMELKDITMFSKLISSQLMKEPSNGEVKKKKPQT